MDREELKGLSSSIIRELMNGAFFVEDIWRG